MNEITRESLIITARRYPEMANKNDSDFRQLVFEVYWSEILRRYESRLWYRALRLWRVFRPDDFSADGAALDYDRFVYARLICVSQRVIRIIERSIHRDPALQLQVWTEIPGKQLELF